MILTLLASGASYIAGVVSGVYLSEHKMLTMVDVKQSAVNLVASARKLTSTKTTKTPVPH